MIVIGIAGGSASGKSYIINSIVDELSKNYSVNKIGLDDYYKDQSDKTYEERCLTNYDHPDAFDFDLMMKNIQDLKDGLEITKPTYDYSVHNRSTISETMNSSDILVLDGLFTLYDPSIREICDYTVYVDALEEVRFKRRLARDTVERARSVESITKQFNETVKPMHDAFIEPSKEYADTIIENNSDTFDIDLDSLFVKLKALID